MFLVGGSILRELLFETLYAWVNLDGLIKDVYFRKRIKQKAREILASFYDLQGIDRKEKLASVAQYKEGQKLISLLQESSELLDLMMHLELGSHPSPFLLTKKKILRFWSEILASDGQEFLTAEKSPTTFKKRRGGGSTTQLGFKENELKKNQNQETKKEDDVLKFITEHGPATVQEIADSLGMVSSRTVYRNLNKLVSRGLLEKDSSGQPAVFKLLTDQLT